MTLAQTLKEKKELSNDLKRRYKLPLKNKALWLIQVSNKTLLNKSTLKAFDFTVVDSDLSNLSQYSEKAIVTIAPEDNHYSSVLKEYNPMKSVWNAYLYEETNEWSIFYAVARYLENYKISFDNKSLVKNVYEG